MKKVISRLGSCSYTSEGFSTTKQAADFATGLAASGRCSSADIVTYVGDDLLEFLRMELKEEESKAAHTERSEQRMEELRACKRLINGMRHDVEAELETMSCGENAKAWMKRE